MSIDIVLVNPSNKREMFGPLRELAANEPPLWTGLLAGYVRSKGFSVRVIDADTEGWGPEETMAKILEYNPSVVGIGAVGANPSASSTPKMPAARAVLELIKDKLPDVKTILYGIHPSSLPERTLREEPVDYVCKGEILLPAVEFLQKFKAGELNDETNIKGLWYRKGDEIVDTGWADQVTNLDEIPYVAWDLLPMEKYRAHTWHCYGHIKERSPYAIIFTSLGCPFNCSYCNIHDLYGSKPGIRYRSPQNVIEEIDYLVKTYNVKNVKFLDELFVMSVNKKLNQRMEEICDLLIERDYGLNIWVYARIDTVSPEILKKLKRAGVNWVAYGIEGGNKAIRDKVSKGQFNEDRISQAVRWTYEAGLHICGNFMFGLPNDTFETMQETLDLAKSINCEYANIYCTMAYPGSKLYDESVANGVKLPENWMGYSQYGAHTIPLPTNHLSAAEVLRFRDNAFNEYFGSEKYQNMILEKFDQETLDHINEMLSHNVERNLLKEGAEASV